MTTNPIMGVVIFAMFWCSNWLNSNGWQIVEAMHDVVFSKMLSMIL
jgi:hypothetical protein